MKKRQKKRTSIVVGNGRACKQCGEIMERWTHTVDFIPQDGLGRYEYWDKCTNFKCKVQIVYEPGSFRHSDPVKERQVNHVIQEIDRGQATWFDSATDDRAASEGATTGPEETPAASEVISDLSRLLVVEKFAYDPITKKCSVVGRARLSEAISLCAYGSERGISSVPGPVRSIGIIRKYRHERQH